MDNRSAVYLFNETVCPVIGTIGDSENGAEELQRMTPLWGALLGLGVPTHLMPARTMAFKSSVDPGIDKRKAAAGFLRDWADAIEGPEVVKARFEADLKAFGEKDG